jgi:hypothetical protein
MTLVSQSSLSAEKRQRRKVMRSPAQTSGRNTQWSSADVISFLYEENLVEEKLQRKLKIFNTV